jgi:hypothetical protein
MRVSKQAAITVNESGSKTPIELRDAASERRRSKRFPFSEDVIYKFGDRKVVTAGAGSTLNMSSRGVLFTTTHSLPIGKVLQFSVNWPALLDDGCLLRFVATGLVLRCENNCAAVRITKYEFRTRARSSARPDAGTQFSPTVRTVAQPLAHAELSGMQRARRSK